MTNFDRMKELTVEEMAEAIAKMAADCNDCGGCSDCDGNCLSCIEDKLKQQP